MNLLPLALALSSLLSDSVAVAAPLDPIAEAGRTFLATGKPAIVSGPVAARYPFGHTVPVVRCAPLVVCDIELEAGETVLDVATGDSERWIVDQMASTSPHVVVKPVDYGLSTNLLIATSKRTYNLLLVSPEKAAADPDSLTRRTAFWYPDELVRHVEAAQAAEALAASRKADASVATLDLSDPTRLNFAYSIKPSSLPTSPVRVLDDGVRTYIQLPASRSRRETPALVAISDDGETHLLNYRLRDDWIIADATFAKAQLLLGAGRHQTKVTITNKTLARTSR